MFIKMTNLIKASTLIDIKFQPVLNKPLKALLSQLSNYLKMHAFTVIILITTMEYLSQVVTFSP